MPSIHPAWLPARPASSLRTPEPRGLTVHFDILPGRNVPGVVLTHACADELEPPVPAPERRQRPADGVHERPGLVGREGEAGTPTGRRIEVSHRVEQAAG